MLAVAQSLGLVGIDGFGVRVEVNVSGGLPGFELVGLPDAAVKESKERVTTAMKNSGFLYPDGRVVVNLAPADQKKEGPAFDLPMAVGILCAAGQIRKECLEGAAFLGELSLDGSVRPVRGALPLTISARRLGIAEIFLPAENAEEVRCVEGIRVYPVTSLRQTVEHLTEKALIPPQEKVAYSQLLGERHFEADFAFVKGQKSAKRALEIAAAGGHNVLMIGPPGSGKTLMARCIPTILPDMTFEEALEVTRIHSAAGLMDGGGLLVERPFRSPHHTASSVSLVGGGLHAQPGEISKAHHGVLFLDELPEYRRDVLEAMRQPMEDGFVTITRANAQSTYPSQFMLVCSMNPCPCGNYGSRTQKCRCSSGEIRRYLGRISGPLLDRIDMHIEVESVPAERIAQSAPEEPSAAIRARVAEAREVQHERYKGRGIACNARLDARSIAEYCALSPEAQALLTRASQTMGLSNRAFTRVIKVARTIADLAHSAEIGVDHVAEAVQYRALDRKYWG